MKITATILQSIGHKGIADALDTGQGASAHFAAGDWAALSFLPLGGHSPAWIAAEINGLFELPRSRPALRQVVVP